MRLLFSLVLVVPLVAGSPTAAQDEPIREAAQRLRNLSARPDLTSENAFLHEQVGSLVERLRKAPPGSFVAGRLELAVKDLLDASERIIESRNGRLSRDASEETRRLMARDLERTYFRIQQADYFSRQSQESSGPQYVWVARRLYQLGRAAYDEREYARVRLLSEACRNIIGALELLAQAVAGVPDPPRLQEG
ncbi:MAG: hypothetical protein ACRD3C_24800 [Vicinamibacterales bacterium]